ncbi:MAG: aminomethyl-transferring glycine dehydrogenase [Verrucomicrobiales bacterium]|nr:aminomethyl-transferring glycine dehydrogenase [Verrucomicrobiales bacterium]
MECTPEADGMLPAHPDRYVDRHLGPRPEELAAMLGAVGVRDLEALTDQTVPADIRLPGPPALPPPLTEFAALQRLREMANQNHVARSFIGLGYHDCIVPPVILRNVLENPGWYTQYTPYQSEISQGRLEALLTFQTMVCDLTGLDIANASLLDEATAAAEAMMLALRVKGVSGRRRCLVAGDCHPQTIEVVRTRARPLGVEVDVSPRARLQPDETVFAVLLQYPATDGALFDPAAVIQAAHDAGALVIVATDLLALTLLRPPGEFGADIAVGSAQRFGVPLGFGGPHAGFMATRDSLKRQLPGRLVGVSKDSRGRPAYRLALGTREQHIRREKATSNICTAQALLANLAAFYAVYHGPEGLQAIARRVHGLAAGLAAGLRRLGWRIAHDTFFDTIRVEGEPERIQAAFAGAARAGINLRRLADHALGVALDETTSPKEVTGLWTVFNHGAAPDFGFESIAAGPAATVLPAAMGRTSEFLSAPVFHRYRSETEMLRYLRRLESRDLSLTASMIPLGSCTMKLNAAGAMLPVSWPGFAGVHPFAPADQTAGYAALFRDLEDWLATLTGFTAVSLQPNAGSQGEYAGLLVIRAYHESRGEAHRDVCLIPTSAHGTNPASAIMAGLRVIAVACDAAGNIDLDDLRRKAATHRDELAALMVTYPSTHGVFEPGIREICRIVHEHGGQVYLDGANMNAQVGLTSPGVIGADVCHLNLHKTFSIPHGGGGPGVGPICVAAHLAPFLPGHELAGQSGGQRGGAVSAAPWGSAGILPISWFYIACMGAEGLKRASQVAILNANYIAHRLQEAFPVLYRGAAGRVAHECILDLRQFKSVTAEDVAKRLMDFGFHAPTLSWPVAGTLMVEPTESESRAELDRFCDAMLAIRAEIAAVETGAMDHRDNPLKNAPHTADMIASSGWPHPYSREQAAFPLPAQREFKFWPAVGRVDNVLGDRNPLCTCAGIAAYAETPGAGPG